MLGQLRPSRGQLPRNRLLSRRPRLVISLHRMHTGLLLWTFEGAALPTCACPAGMSQVLGVWGEAEPRGRAQRLRPLEQHCQELEIKDGAGASFITASPGGPRPGAPYPASASNQRRFPASLPTLPPPPGPAGLGADEKLPRWVPVLPPPPLLPLPAAAATQVEGLRAVLNGRQGAFLISFSSISAVP